MKRAPKIRSWPELVVLVSSRTKKRDQSLCWIYASNATKRPPRIKNGDLKIDPRAIVVDRTDGPNIFVKCGTKACLNPAHLSLHPDVVRRAIARVEEARKVVETSIAKINVRESDFRANLPKWSFETMKEKQKALIELRREHRLGLGRLKRAEHRVVKLIQQYGEDTLAVCIDGREL